MNTMLQSCARTVSRRAHQTRGVTRPLVALRRNMSAQPQAETKSADAPPAAEGSGSNDLATKLQEKEDEVKEITNRLRYAQADFLNLQRNAQKEKDQTRDYAITKLAKDLVSTVDVLALALKSVPEDARKGNQLYEGVEMTQRSLLQSLAKYGVEQYDPTGEKFDPNLHEALYMAPVPGKTPGTVLETQKLGYKIKDRVLRAAQVGVVQDAP
ncbi:GrpE-domain-containing protein [Ceratobasidium sp. AG-I]|nr:GrpE-domain-containing protein [Ceratobasidium sp. AG-I]